MSEMGSKDGRQAGMVLLGQPQREDIELSVAGEHRVEGGKIAQRLLDHLRPRIDEDPVNGGDGVAQLLGAVGGEQQPKRIFALALLVERADDFTQVIHTAVGGSGPGPGFKRREIPPAHDARQHAHFEEGDELFLRVDLAASGGRGLGPPCRAKNAVAIEREQARKEAWPRRFGRRLEREHLHMAFAHAQMIAVPGNWVPDDLAVYAFVAAELAGSGPLFKIEEVAEEVECGTLVEQAQPERSSQVSHQNRGRLFKVGQHSRGAGGVLLRLLLECSDLWRLDGQAPVQVNPPKARSLLKV